MPRAKYSVKPAVAQNEVLARTLACQSKSQIAREMSIDRETVTRIQECHNLPQLLADSRQYTVENVLPKAIRAVEAQLEDRDSKEDGNLGARVMEGVGVLSDNASKVTFRFSDDARLQLALTQLDVAPVQAGSNVPLAQAATDLHIGPPLVSASPATPASTPTEAAAKPGGINLNLE